MLAAVFLINLLIPAWMGVSVASPQYDNNAKKLLSKRYVPIIGSANVPTIGSGNVPTIGSGNVPTIGSGNVPTIGSSSVPIIGSGAVPTITSTVPSITTNANFPYVTIGSCVNGICPNGYACYQNRCVEAPNYYGPCLSNGYCSMGICNAGRCVG